jgi:glycosyltransferase involved in cell wall biosynthesis
MKIAWVTRSFLDYRVPVFKEMSSLEDVDFCLFYCKEAVPMRVNNKIVSLLNENQLGFDGELRFPYPNMSDIPEKYGIKRLPRIFFQPKLINNLLKFQPDIIITDGFAKWTYVALYLHVFKKIPHVMCYERTAHTERNAQWYKTKYRQFVMRWIDVICCSGNLCADYVKSLGYTADKITCGHIVADTEELAITVENISQTQVDELREKYQVKGTLLLYTGQIIQRKGISELLTAWAELLFDEPITLMLVGDGIQLKEMQEKVALLDNVIFTGRIDYDDIPLFYKAADAFIIPTLEDNWSLVVPEAMACGLPIICSKYNGCHPELVTPENGWVFDPLDKANTSETLLSAVESKDKFVAMGQASRELITNGHTPKYAAKAIYKTCEVALNKQ